MQNEELKDAIIGRDCETGRPVYSLELIIGKIRQDHGCSYEDADDIACNGIVPQAYMEGDKRPIIVDTRNSGAINCWIVAGHADLECVCYAFFKREDAVMCGARLFANNSEQKDAPGIVQRLYDAAPKDGGVYFFDDNGDGFNGVEIRAPYAWVSVYKAKLT